MRDEQFAQGIWMDQPVLNPDNAEHIANTVIEFLAGYGCHTPATPPVVQGLVQALRDAVLYLCGLGGRTIEGLALDEQVLIAGQNQTVRDATAHLYRMFDAVPRIGATATSKILHILRPKLFVMWDEGIRDGYLQEVPESADGYCAFLTHMRDLAQQVNQGFQQAGLHHEGGPAGYLSQQLGINLPKTLAKYLDEYNWITITQRIDLPPHWHPN